MKNYSTIEKDQLNHHLTSTDTDFVKEFIGFWKEIRNQIKGSKIENNLKKPTFDVSKTIKTICCQLFKHITEPFFEKWIESYSFIKKDKGYIETLYSYEISLDNFSFLLPHKLVAYEILRPQNTQFTNLDRIKSIEELLFYLIRTFRDLNLHLNRNDEKIIELLTSKEFITISERYPSQKELAKLVGCSEATYNRRETKLAETYVLSMIYRIIIDQLGYETIFLISKPTDPKKDVSFLDQYSLASIPYSYGKNIGFQKIIQYPYRNYNFYQKLNQLCLNDDDSFFAKLNHGYIGWNLVSFHRDPSKRWKVLPPILNTYNWDDLIYTEDKGITYNLIPNTNPFRLTELEIELISLFSKYGTRYDVNLSKKLKKTEKYIRKTWGKLIENKLLHRFPLVSNIGLSIKPWITLIGNNNNDIKFQNTVIIRVIEHLKVFPFSYLFYRLSQTSTDDLPLLAGLVYLPFSWATDFNIMWNDLSSFGFIPKIEFSYNRKIRWNINLLETYYSFED